MQYMSVSSGLPYPLGATVDANGCNFSIECKAAQKVELCLFDGQTEQALESHSLPAKTGDVWHCYLPHIAPGQLYGYRVSGVNDLAKGLIFDPQKLLIDPYAKALNKPLIWQEQSYQDDSQQMIPKAIVCPKSRAFQWQDKPNIALNNTVIYEAHVKGLTQLYPDMPDAYRGKFLGVCQPQVLAHLKSLGITAVQLMPVAAFMPEAFITKKGLTNYWGYNPVNYFSPDPRYVLQDGIAEFRTMVETLHSQGIEVILDVVFNHTAESGVDGPLLSFKGFNNAAAYLFAPDQQGSVDYTQYINNSGCGNSVNTAHPYILKMVMDSLRYWLTDMGVDGFRFDLAASLGRDPYDFSNQSGIFRAMAQDPVLAKCKLIAEPWDIGQDGYRLGQFPSQWVECNDKYRDTARAFWRGDKGHLSDFATRLMGSRDLFCKQERSILSSVNHISYHDGFTLDDLVSYQDRHNLANLEDNRDGHGHNLSANYGEEGPSTDLAILALRQRQKRNLFATLMLSQGLPHVLGGDELSRSQQGNNNAYCQDNEMSWLNWQLDSRQLDFLAFCKTVIALRKSSELLNNLHLEDDHYQLGHNVEKVNWYRADGQSMQADDWQDENRQAFCVELQGAVGTAMYCHQHWLLIFNASEQDLDFKLPLLAQDKRWCSELDTRYDNISDLPASICQADYQQAYRSLSLLKCTDARS
jgi:glycogen operon protein